MTWDVPVAENCEACGQTLFKLSGRGYRKPFCINETCKNFLPEDKRGYKKKTDSNAVEDKEGKKGKEGKDANKPKKEKKDVVVKSETKKAPVKKPASDKTPAKKTTSRGKAGASKKSDGDSA